MKAKEYCELAERLDRFQQQLVPTIIIKDDNSPLISLKESNFNLVFEPSFYKNYRYMVREAIFKKIGRISKILDKDDKRLIIRSVWRGFAHQKLLHDRRVKIITEKHPNKSLKEIHEIVSYFIAPEKGSMHATGGAVDALIYDLKKDCVMDFGNNDGLILELNKTCYPFHPDISAQVRENRGLLINLFDKEGFVVDPKEYWHFDYGNVNWAVEKGKKYAKYGTIKSLQIIE